jgi:uncharacterized protein DUF6894
MRYYFHLVSCHGEILDETGVEVTDLEAAEAEALKAIQELQEEDPQADEDLQGWQLIITDQSGDILGYVRYPEGLRGAVVLGSRPGGLSGAKRPFLL